jgi:hypothetical protein
MVSVALRSSPLFVAAVNDTTPLPEPELPPVIVSQEALLLAVHAHPDPAVTETGAPLPPAAGNVWLVGAMLYVHGVTPACVTLNGRPETDSVAVRESPVLAATLNTTAPGPSPVAPAVMETHGTVLVAVH